jgi:hypothetical protein
VEALRNRGPEGLAHGRLTGDGGGRRTVVSGSRDRQVARGHPYRRRSILTIRRLTERQGACFGDGDG